MNKIIRYVIRMRNGDYMTSDFSDNQLGLVLVSSTDNPIDASLFKKRAIAQDCIHRLLNNNTPMECVYDKENPPIEVVELNIELKNAI